MSYKVLCEDLKITILKEIESGNYLPIRETLYNSIIWSAFRCVQTGTDSKVLGGLSLYKHRFEYFPKQGFPAYVYRPRMASLPHLRPAVMVQVMSLLDGQIAHVTCTVWGQLYDFSDKLVSHDLLKTNFAVYIDR